MVVAFVLVELPVMFKSPSTVELAVEIKPARGERPVTPRVPPTEASPAIVAAPTMGELAWATNPETRVERRVTSRGRERVGLA